MLKMNKREERVWDMVYAAVFSKYARDGDESWEETAGRAEEASNKAVTFLRDKANASP